MKKVRYTTKMNLYLRILVAAYIVYLAYGILPGIQEAVGNEKVLMIIALIFLVFAGVTIIVFAVKGLIKKEYYEAYEIDELEEEKKQSDDEKKNESEK